MHVSQENVSWEFIERQEPELLLVSVIKKVRARSRIANNVMLRDWIAWGLSFVARFLTQSVSKECHGPCILQKIYLNNAFILHWT